MTELFDTHAHYNDTRFAGEFPGGAPAALRAAREAGVTRILNCSTNPENCRSSLSLAETHEGIYAAAGLHPEDCFHFSAGNDPALVDALRPLLAHPKAVAIGEIGLDYHYPEETDRQRQLFFFDAQLSLAEELEMPVVIHDRDAHGETFDVLCAHPKVTGVLHSYSGSPEMARQYAAKGWYLSFGGPVTYKNAEKVRDSVRAVPRDRLLIETDCPYLSPVPFRGKINFSGYLPYTCRAVADILGLAPEETADLTRENGCRLFGIR